MPLLTLITLKNNAMQQVIDVNQNLIELRQLVIELKGQVDQLQYQIAKINKPVVDKLMSTKDVAEHLQVTTQWVILHKHDIGCSKRTGKLLFKRSDVEAFSKSDYFKI
jgi:hypothetical protein